MLTLTKSLLEEPGIRRLISGIDAGTCPAVVSGLSEIHRAHIASVIRAATMRPIAVICSAEDECERLASDICSLTMEQAVTINAREYLFHSVEVASHQIEQRRVASLTALTENRAPIVVMSISGALQRTMPPEYLKEASQTLVIHKEYILDDIVNKLLICGYSRSG